MKSSYKNYFFIGSIILFYFIIAHTTILLLDDFAWGTSTGLARMKSNFENYNGRYLGNYIIIGMTRFYLAQIIIPTVVNSGIVLLIHKIFNRKIDLPIIMFFMLIMPFEIYRQTYGFMSGFANYNTALFFILAVIYLIKKETTSIADLVLLSSVGFAVQLFLENVSIINIILTSTLLIFSLFKKKNLLKSTILFISNLLGTVLMFSNPAYTSNATGRGLTNIDLNKIPQIFLTEWSELFFKNNIALIILLSLGIYLISQKNIFLKYTLFVIPTYFFIRYNLDVHWKKLPTKLLYLEGLLLLLLIILSFYVVYKSTTLDNKIKSGFYFFFILGGMYSGPHLAILRDGNPFVFPRNVLVSYILISVSIIYLYIPFLQSKKTIDVRKPITSIAVTSMLIVGSMSLVNNTFNNIRIESAKTSIDEGAREVYLPRLPFEKLYYPWSVSEASASFVKNYKEFYNIPDYIKIEEVSRQNKYTYID